MAGIGLSQAELDGLSAPSPDSRKRRNEDPSESISPTSVRLLASGMRGRASLSEGRLSGAGSVLSLPSPCRTRRQLWQQLCSSADSPRKGASARASDASAKFASCLDDELRLPSPIGPLPLPAAALHTPTELSVSAESCQRPSNPWPPLEPCSPDKTVESENSGSFVNACGTLAAWAAGLGTEGTLESETEQKENIAVERDAEATIASKEQAQTGQHRDTNASARTGSSCSGSAALVEFQPQAPMDTPQTNAIVGVSPTLSSVWPPLVGDPRLFSISTPLCAANAVSNHAQATRDSGDHARRAEKLIAYIHAADVELMKRETCVEERERQAHDEEEELLRRRGELETEVSKLQAQRVELDTQARNLMSQALAEERGRVDTTNSATQTDHCLRTSGTQTSLTSARRRTSSSAGRAVSQSQEKRKSCGGWTCMFASFVVCAGVFSMTLVALFFAQAGLASQLPCLHDTSSGRWLSIDVAGVLGRPPCDPGEAPAASSVSAFRWPWSQRQHGEPDPLSRTSGVSAGMDVQRGSTEAPNGLVALAPQSAMLVARNASNVVFSMAAAVFVYALQ